ncbi:MAG: hypothetical protein AAFX57_15195 [Bacteroidota bacterium]
MKLSNPSITNESGKSTVSLQDLATEMQETIIGGGIVSTHTGDHLWVPDLEDDNSLYREGFAIIRFKGK